MGNELKYDSRVMIDFLELFKIPKNMIAIKEIYENLSLDERYLALILLCDDTINYENTDIDANLIEFTRFMSDDIGISLRDMMFQFETSFDENYKDRASDNGKILTDAYHQFIQYGEKGISQAVRDNYDWFKEYLKPFLSEDTSSIDSKIINPIKTGSAAPKR